MLMLRRLLPAACVMIAALVLPACAFAISNTVPPVVTGSTVQGQTLTTDNGSWNQPPVSYSYVWKHITHAGVSTVIAGATSQTYVTQTTDVGDTVKSVVTACNSVGGCASAPSAPVGPITAATGVNFYVAQTAAGTGDASSCANAESVATLNSNTHSEWTAGTTIHLCGTITTSVTAAGSGSSGNPITVKWESGAKLSKAVCPASGCFDTNSKTNLTLDGGTNGIIESTANGTNLANHVSAVEGVHATSCANCMIENLTIQNMYVHVAPGDSGLSHTQNNGIHFSGSGITIQNNTMHDAGWMLYQEAGSSDANVTISGNDIYNADHGWALAGPPTSGGNIGPFIFSSNHVHDFSNWDTTANSYHHDGIHCYSANGVGAMPHYNAVYIYNNRFDGGNGGTNMTADIFLEGTSSGSTPCSDSTSNFYVFNNVFVGSGPIGNGLVGLENDSTGDREYNNTLIGSGTGSGVCQYDPVATVTFENDVASTCNQLIYKGTGSSFATASPNWNVYANGGSNSFVCNGNFYAFTAFGSWKTCAGGDGNSSTAASALLNSDGSPQAGSPVLGAGTNLTGLCSGTLTALCSGIDGTARPSTGAWDAGAY